MKKKTGELIESIWFMAPLLFTGGFLNAYTYLTRGKVFANNQTANISKLGINLFQGNWGGALDALYPMIACVLGAFFAECVKNQPGIRARGEYQWQRWILGIELIVLTAVGFVPNTVPNVIVNLTMSFFTAWQLSGFRKLEGWVLNTTICTGNLRSLGAYWYNAMFVEKDPAFTAKTLRFTAGVLAFVIGAFAGAALSTWVGVRAIWFVALVIACLLAAHIRSGKN